MFLYLKSLELQGFKSFPDKIKLDFGKGLTAVVGPNGSGKSNIGDAVRWVLGEQSTKTLRGGKMEDVIFAGTQQRKPVGFAQVTLNIDNVSRSLLIDEDLVSVSRKLYRSGESEYLINGKSVRLKDVLELFMDTGLGRDGYSIIGQGRVAEIVSNKSNERRQIFEEAAGISKFRYKKEEAERKLTAAEDNLLRLTDITSELQSRVEPLRQQSEKANKFIGLSEEKKSLEISLWLHKLDELRQQLQNIEDKYLVSSSEYENLDNDIDKLEQEIAQAYQSMQQVSVKIENIRTEILDTEKNNTSVHSDIAVFENEIVHLKESIKSSHDRIDQINLSKTNSAELINSENILLSEFDTKEKNLSDEIQLSTDKLTGLVAKSDEFDNALNDKNAYLNSLYIKRTEYNFTVNSAKSSVEQIKSDRENAESNSAEIDENLKSYAQEKDETVSAISKVDEHILETENKITGFSKLLEGKLSHLDDAQKEYNATDIRLRELNQKLSLLRDLEKNMEGFAFSVKEVIKASNSGRLRGISGSVAQIIKVDSKYTVAIETALGGALQNVIVDNEDTAKRCIALLKENKSGRATFLPVTSVKGRELSENNLDMQEGFIDIASDIVDCDEKYRGIILSLLGRIVIAEDINSATKIAKKYGYKFKIVTLDGQVINAGGSFTGGSASKSTGVLSRKNEIDNIVNECSLLEKKTDTLSEKVNTYKAETDKLKLDIEGLKDELSTFRSDKVRFEGELSHISSMLSQLEDKSKEIRENMNAFESRIEKQNNIIENAEKELALCKENIEKNEAELKDTSQRKDSFHSERESLSLHISDLRLSQIELAKDRQACQLKIEQLETLSKDSDNNISVLSADIEKFGNDIKDKEEQINNRKLKLENTALESDKLNEDIKKLQLEHQSFEIKANELRNAEKIKNDEKEGISREIAKFTERKAAVSKDYDNIISDLWEQYQLTRSQAEQINQKIENYTLAQKKLSEIKSAIKALGNVNVASIEEYKEVSERYEYLSSQLDDIKKSKSELLNLIDDLTDNMKEMFTENFRIINENFKHIFVELFGGGKAELTLTDQSDVLESGIEINVAPPGKVIKSLSLLSGGEQSFIAIAIYFAILKLKPSPFCILDEIEAALDDVNVSKFASYLHNFINTTQFILITHRRGTMEEADVLYGVTMQEKGISKLLKMDTHENVDLSDRS